MKIGNIFKKVVKQEEDPEQESNVVAKERLQLVLMQDRANVSAEFLEMMKNEIVSVVQKYIDVDEDAMDIRLTTEPNEDGTNGIPRIYANIPIIQIKNESKFGRLQIQNADGEVISEIGGNKEISKFAEINDGEIFSEGEEDDDIEIKGTIIDRKEVEDDEVQNVEPVKQSVVVEEDNKTQVEEYDEESLLEETIEELEEYDEDEYDDELEEDDDDVTFDDLLKAAENEESDHEEEVKKMKARVAEAASIEEQDEDSKEDSLLQKLSDIDEDESEIEVENKVESVPKQDTYVPKSHFKKNKKKRRR